jgi:plasmid replication initiation protein
MSKNLEQVSHPNHLIEAPLFKSNVQLKIFVKVIATVRRKPSDTTYSFDILDLLREFGITSKKYEFLREEFKKMFIAVDIVKPTSEQFHLACIFLWVKAGKHTGQIEFKISDEVKTAIKNIEFGYTPYFIENVMGLTSKYSTRLYQNLKRFEKLKVISFSLTRVKEFLGLKSSQYTQYKSFNQNVLGPAIKEVSKKTDISVTFETSKRGRNTHSLTFFITPIPRRNEKKAKKLLVSEEQRDNSKKLQGLGVSPSMIETLCDEFDPVRVFTNIEYTQSQVDSGKEKDNIAGFVVHAIKDDYYTLISSDEKKKKEAKAKKESHQPKETLFLSFDQVSQLKEDDESNLVFWLRLGRMGNVHRDVRSKFVP